MSQMGDFFFDSGKTYLTKYYQVGCWEGDPQTRNTPSPAMMLFS